MKKYLIVFFSLMAVSVIILYAQTIMPNSNVEKSSAPKQTNLYKTSSAMTATDEPKKVLMHYMGWFGPDSLGIHWEYGLPRKPIIGYYNSQSWATQMYHILLSWSCGIDGLVINVKDTFDTQSLKMLTPTLKRIRDIDSTTFKYNFAVSYDDQGMDVLGTDTAETKFEFLRDKILPNNPSYLKYNDKAVVFIFNYDNPSYLDAKDYKTVLEEVYTSERPKIFWNEIIPADTIVANSFYPWVKPDPWWDWRADGSNWGKNYLAWYYNTIGVTKGIDFGIGGVWPGFDDRSCSWGKHRWMDRRKGEVYDSTWLLTNQYNSELPLNWVIIETWNDWNEGSEIEPSEVFGYQYLKSTIKNINAFKYPKDSIKSDTCKFLAALKIYEAADYLVRNPNDSATYYPCLQKAIKFFILNQKDISFCDTTCIIDSLEFCCTGKNSLEFKKGTFEIYPNPAKDQFNIRQQSNDPYTLQLTNIQGKVMLYLEGKKQLETVDVSQFPKGLYLVRVKQNNQVFEKKIVVQ
jgi:hypothetical protein